MEKTPLAAFKKNAKRKKQVIVFIDESGLSERPHQVKTWAPKGQTPQLQISFSWGKLSLIGGISFWKCYFKMHRGSITSKELIGFLKSLRRQIKRKLLIIWDGLPAHRSKAVREYIASTKGKIEAERLPAYAPELNPVEYLWANLKHHELANFCPENLAELSSFAKKKLARIRRRPKIVRACWKLSQLSLGL